jgi:hypothetical protein
MANTSRLAAQSTKALAKLVKKALEDLKKSSDKTVSAKKNIKNAEKLNTLVENMLDPVAEEGITGAAANKLYREAAAEALKSEKQIDLPLGRLVETSELGARRYDKLGRGREKTPIQTLEDMVEFQRKIKDDPELSKDESLPTVLDLLLREEIEKRGAKEFKDSTRLYGGEPKFMDLKEGDLARQPSQTIKGAGKIANSMEAVDTPIEPVLRGTGTAEDFISTGRATLAVNDLLKKEPSLGKKYSREFLVQEYMKRNSSNNNTNNLKWYQIPEIKTFVNQIIKDKPELLNTLTPEEIAAPLVRDYKVSKRRQGVGYMKFPGAKVGDSAVIQTTPGAGMQRDPLGGGYLGDKGGDKFVRGQFARSESIPTVDTFDPTYGMRSGEIGPPTTGALQRNVPLEPQQFMSGMAYRPKEIMLQPASEGLSIPGIRTEGPPEFFRGTAKTKQLLGKPSRVGTIKGIGDNRGPVLEGDIPGDVTPAQMSVAAKALRNLDEKAFLRQQAGDAERMGVEPLALQAIEGERSLSGKPFSMGDRGPMPWTVTTPDDVAKLVPEDKILYKRNSDQFFNLIRYFVQEEGMSQRNATAAAKQYMLGELSESAASARIGMSKTFDEVGDTVRQERAASMIAPEDDGATTLGDSLSEDILNQLGEIDKKKGGRVKAKKKTKAIPKILKNRNNKGKKKLSKPLGVGAAQRGWGAVRSS